MSSFRSRQRASQRRDQTSRERAANSPAGGNPNAPDRQPQDGKPRAPYSGQRPGPGKPDWKAGQEPRQFDKRPQGEGQQKRFHRDGDKPAWQPRQDDRRFDKRDDRGEGQQKRFHRDGDKLAWQPRQDDRRYDRDRGPSNRKPLPEGVERASEFRRDGAPQDKRYSRDRGPSGRKPLHTDDAPPRPFKPRAEGDDRRDDKPQWQPREDRAPRHDGDAPRK
ncbi:hypothetical protein ABI908_19595, partial [Chromobacterium phragmitis]